MAIGLEKGPTVPDTCSDTTCEGSNWITLNAFGETVLIPFVMDSKIYDGGVTRFAGGPLSQVIYRSENDSLEIFSNWGGISAGFALCQRNA